jgi:hypothetical protein
MVLANINRVCTDPMNETHEGYPPTFDTTFLYTRPKYGLLLMEIISGYVRCLSIRPVLSHRVLSCYGRLRRVFLIIPARSMLAVSPLEAPKVQATLFV